MTDTCDKKEEGKPKPMASTLFYGMHRAPVLYERRNIEDVMSVEALLFGFYNLNIYKTAFYDRPNKDRVVKMLNVDLEMGEVLIPIKFLHRMEYKEGITDNPPSVFFFGFAQYDKTLAKYQEKIRKEFQPFVTREQYKVNELMEVAMGGFYGVKKARSEDYCRVRVVEIDMIARTVRYWAVDEAFFGECPYSDLIVLNEAVATLPLLAVPGIFGVDPSPASLQKFEGPSKAYCRAKILHPTYRWDYCPRKVSLV